MDLYDIVFPVNLGALTYRCPQKLFEHIEPGVIVSAPLKGSVAQGVVLRKSTESPEGKVKDIVQVVSPLPVLSRSLLRLIEWMADYYIAEYGIVLKNAIPKEVLTEERTIGRRVRSQQNPGAMVPSAHFSDVSVDTEMVDAIRDSIRTSTYRTFLLHAPSSSYTRSFVLNTLLDADHCIILVPELVSLPPVYALLRERFGQRVCLYHSELSQTQRREAFKRILSSESDIVVGTRSAIFAPLKKVSLIVAIQEQSTSYKQESSPRYHARDVAVMRGFFEQATVLLASISPSVESFYNCKRGKYTLLQPAEAKGKTRVKIVDMRYEKLVKPYLSKTVVDKAKTIVNDDRKIIFLVNRRGHSTLLLCRDCQYVEECPRCDIPLVYHRSDAFMHCHYCGHQRKVPEICTRCKGHNLTLLGAGTQKVEEGLQDILGVPSVRIDSDTIRGKSAMRAVTASAGKVETQILVGTKMLSRRLTPDIRISMAAILNADSFLDLPDFRAAEKAYHELAAVMDTVEVDGEIVIQTRMPHHDMFKALKTKNADLFFQEELRRREALRYPPFAHLILLSCTSRNDLTKDIAEIIKTDSRSGEILGPSISKNKKGDNEYRLLLKSADRGRLHETARSIVNALKNALDVRVKVDVDPQVI